MTILTAGTVLAGARQYSLVSGYTRAAADLIAIAAVIAGLAWLVKRLYRSAFRRRR